jgi:predicted MFS family arabinose efflux permease
MTMQPVLINLALAWVLVLLGFASGFGLGLHFHKENWLGGYASFKRRLYRLAHISFFGLAVANLMFYFTAREWAGGWTVTAASWGFVIGAVSMPLCCVLMASFPKLRSLFALPVFSLLMAGGLTLWEVIHR